MPSSFSPPDNDDNAAASTALLIKAAKKSLKRQNSGQMKLKHLAKQITGRHGDGHRLSTKQVKELIKTSTKFQVDGNKMVSLKRKRRNGGSSGASSPNTDVVVEERDGGSDDKSDNNRREKKQHKKTTDAANSNSNSTANDSQTWRRDNKIIIRPATDDHEGNDDNKKQQQELETNPAFYPCTTFDDNSMSMIAKALIDQCKHNTFVRPSPIQAQSWPILTSGRDMVGIAETGSGKTLAFALPALSSLSAAQANQRRGGGGGGERRLPRMLVLAPTRELAMQSESVLNEFGAVVGLQSLTVYGGVPKHTQTTQLKKSNVDIVVATPGRIKDLIQEGSCDLRDIVYLVLDEADRMLDMGFEEDVKFIIGQCTHDQRQTTMFSATWPNAIQQIAHNYMRDPIRVYVGFEDVDILDDSLSANKRVKQNIEVLDDRAREARLRQILKQVHDSKNRVLVFALYKKEAERLEYSLRNSGWNNVCSIHGNKNQVARTEALARFKDGSCPLMIATDVAARGLDIPNVEVVINFTFPLTIEDYVHRIGRTGRMGKWGVSYTFFQPTDKLRAGELQQVLRQVGQPIPEELAKFGSTIKKKEHKLYGNFGPRGTSQPMKKATKITFNYTSDDE